MEHKWNRTDCLYIICHIIALFSISACNGTNQFSIFVGQRNGSTIIFHLTANLKILIQRFSYTLIKICNFAFRVCICQRQHRVFMRNLREILANVTADTHSGRIFIFIFRMCQLQILEFTHLIIKLLI